MMGPLDDLRQALAAYRDRPELLRAGVLALAADRVLISASEGEKAVSEQGALREALAELVACVEISPDHNKALQAWIGTLDHKDGCKRHGDQYCSCGLSNRRWEIECILDECAGYHGTAAIDKARAALSATPSEAVSPEPTELPGMWDQSDLIGGWTDCVPRAGKR